MKVRWEGGDAIISQMDISDLVKFSYEQGKRTLEKREPEILKKHGQFLAPPAVARYMAKQLGEIENGSTILEPAIGSGVLVCAVIERLINEKRPVEVWLTAYEIDKELWEISRQVLDIASREAEKNRIKIHWQVFQDDFILARLPEQQPSIFRCLKTNHI